MMPKRFVPSLVLSLALAGSAFASSGGTDSTAYAGSAEVRSTISPGMDPGGAPESDAISFIKNDGTPLLVVAILAVIFLVAVSIAADKADYP